MSATPIRAEVPRAPSLLPLPAAEAAVSPAPLSGGAGRPPSPDRYLPAAAAPERLEARVVPPALPGSKPPAGAPPDLWSVCGL